MAFAIAFDGFVLALATHRREENTVHPTTALASLACQCMGKKNVHEQ
jgi:hypothetical protein